MPFANEGKNGPPKAYIRLKNELNRLLPLIIGTRLGTHNKSELEFYQ